PFLATLCTAQQEMADKAAKETVEFPRFLDYQDDVLEAVREAGEADVQQAITIAGKQEREARLDEIKDAVKAALAERFEGRDKEISAAFRSLTKSSVRRRMLTDKVRMDGRGLADIRTLSAEGEVIPRVHGSALFER